jgi:hypothetical protein
MALQKISKGPWGKNIELQMPFKSVHHFVLYYTHLSIEGKDGAVKNLNIIVKNYLQHYSIWLN